MDRAVSLSNGESPLAPEISWLLRLLPAVRDAASGRNRRVARSDRSRENPTLDRRGLARLRSLHPFAVAGRRSFVVGRLSSVFGRTRSESAQEVYDLSLRPKTIVLGRSIPAYAIKSIFASGSDKGTVAAIFCFHKPNVRICKNFLPRLGRDQDERIVG